MVLLHVQIQLHDVTVYLGFIARVSARAGYFYASEFMLFSTR